MLKQVGTVCIFDNNQDFGQAVTRLRNRYNNSY